MKSRQIALAVGIPVAIIVAIAWPQDRPMESYGDLAKLGPLREIVPNDDLPGYQYNEGGPYGEPMTFEEYRDRCRSWEIKASEKSANDILTEFFHYRSGWKFVHGENAERTETSNDNREIEVKDRFSFYLNAKSSDLLMIGISTAHGIVVRRTLTIYHPDQRRLFWHPIHEWLRTKLHIPDR
jgi:hypothetical protein